MDFTPIIISLLLTVVAYLAFPLIRLLINGGKFPKKKAHKIALWNSIVLGLIFCIATIEISDGNSTWNAGPAFLYYWINRAILTDKNTDDDVSSKAVPEKAPSQKNVGSIILKAIGSVFLGVISSELLLWIILGDSVEGSTALLLLFLVAIPLAVLYYYLFSLIKRNEKKEEKYIPIYEDVTTATKTTGVKIAPTTINVSGKYRNYNIYSDQESDCVSQKEIISVEKNEQVVKTSFCRKCGCKLVEDSRFCNKCGTEIIK